MQKYCRFYSERKKGGTVFRRWVGSVYSLIKIFRKRTIQEQPTSEPQPEPIDVETSTREKCEKCEPLKKTFFSYVEALPKVEVFKTERIELTKKEQLDCWEKDITDLENYFTGIILPAHPVKLNPFSTIIDVSLFIESHLATIKANNGKRTYLPYLNRLQELKQVLATNLN